MSAWISHSSPGLRPTKQYSWQAAVLLWAEMPGGCARGAAAPLIFGDVIEMQSVPKASLKCSQPREMAS